MVHANILLYLRKDCRATLPRDLVAAAHVDNVDDEIGQFATVVRCEVVASGFNEQQIGVEFAVQVFQCCEVLGDIFSDRSVWAAASLNGADARRWKGLVAGEELCVFTGEDVVCHGGKGVFLSKGEGQSKHEGSLSGANGTIQC
ncbi:hypothetical protein HG530_001028 [Fusarium avenaceum]|nr:hypothetical protein HG530_001028 [Fusarium avenaceum]